MHIDFGTLFQLWSDALWFLSMKLVIPTGTGVLIVNNDSSPKHLRSLNERTYWLIKITIRKILQASDFSFIHTPKLSQESCFTILLIRRFIISAPVLILPIFLAVFVMKQKKLLVKLCFETREDSGQISHENSGFILQALQLISITNFQIGIIFQLNFCQ